MHLPCRHEKGVSSSTVVARAVLHEFSAPLLNEVQLVLQVGLLWISPARRVQLGAHAAMAHQFYEPLAGGAGQLLQTLV
jgi:hypothetical protein